MAKNTGITSRIAEHVTRHPGCSRQALCAALSIEVEASTIRDAELAGKIYGAGARYARHYYPTRAQAEVQDARLRMAAAVASRDRKRMRRAQRECKAMLIGTAIELPTIKRTIAATPLGRYESTHAPSVVDSSQARPWAMSFGA